MGWSAAGTAVRDVTTPDADATGTRLTEAVNDIDGAAVEDGAADGGRRGGLVAFGTAAAAGAAGAAGAAAGDGAEKPWSEVLMLCCDADDDSAGFPSNRR